MLSAKFASYLSKRIACSGITLLRLFSKPTERLPRKTMGIAFALLLSIPILNQAFAEGSACTAQPYELPRNEWVQVSLPCAPETNADTVKDIFGDDIPGDYGIDWKVYRYDSSDNLNYDVGEAGSLAQGEAYWIMSLQAPASLDMPSNSQASKANVDITLPTRSDSPAWYLYGFPYEQAQSWDNHRITTSSGDCATDNGCTPAQAKNIINEQVYRWNGAGYDKMDGTAQLEPWGGYWVATLPAGHGLNPVLHIQNSINPVKSSKAYIPDLDFSENDVYKNGQFKHVKTAGELEDAIKKAKPYTTIILKDNSYPGVNAVFPAGMHHITVKAEHKHKAVIHPKGKINDSAFVFS